ncbi:flagella synthesis protein FlgN [Larsenimonas salina]|uniref:flagella synthesis protein FlgN n=1 Tax=Larsenimonas salina TaxID=1295565 RepID=UPI00207342AA|nr:flagellar protein FlgN [Larsenimonas salina]MCM5703735.1 flagellar protein FlgN [Larsenimonas salina]
MTATVFAPDATLRQKVLDALVGEYKALHAFIELLEREQALLQNTDSVDVDTFNQVVERKSALSERLERFSAARLTLVGEHVGNTGRQSIARFMSACGLTRQWQDFLKQVAKAEQINRLNGLKLQIRADHNQRALRVLHEAAGMSLYGANGQSHARGGSNLYSKA